MILYAKSKAQKMVEIIFILTCYPVVSMVETDYISPEMGFSWIGVLIALTVLNTVLANLVTKIDA